VIVREAKAVITAADAPVANVASTAVVRLVAAARVAVIDRRTHRATGKANMAVRAAPVARIPAKAAVSVATRLPVTTLAADITSAIARTPANAAASARGKGGPPNVTAAVAQAPSRVALRRAIAHSDHAALARTELTTSCNATCSSKSG
jgi:hypothetical protein